MNKVLLFAHLRDAVGEEFLMLDASGKTVAELKEDLSNTYHLPKMDTVMTAVNEEFAPDEVIIEDGAEIAFIPPVSGG